jgi:hypothetical protein
MAGASTDQARVCLAVPLLASATLLDVVRQSKPRRRNRGSEAWSNDLFVPKQLGWAVSWVGMPVTCADGSAMLSALRAEQDVRADR